jgi:glycosidase
MNRIAAASKGPENAGYLRARAHVRSAQGAAMAGFLRPGSIRLRGLCAAAAALGLTFITPRLEAGPVPGVETFARTAVEFPHPAHLHLWDIGGDEYLVTFRWKPEGPVTNPAVAGTFNHWSRTDLPMEGPDAEGFYSVTARLREGQHAYKYVADPNLWFEDPLNPHQEQDGAGNSLLWLGAVAYLRDAVAVRGDGRIEERAFRHDPSGTPYLDALGAGEAIVRFRTLAHDVERVEIVFESGGRERRARMTPAGGDSLFDFFEYHYREPAVGESRPRYRFVVHDGGATIEPDQRHTLDLAGARVVDVPEWARHAIWYQIMVDRFRDGNTANNPEFVRDPNTKLRTHPWRSEWYTEYPWERRDGWSFWRWSMYDRLYGGDLEGVIDKLTTLKELGVNAIYLNPVFVSNNAHKYNARTYVHVDDHYGVAGEYARSAAREDLLDPATWEFNASDRLLLRLIREVHAREMRIILDGVFNHVGNDHPAFLDVKEKRQASRFADWFDVVSWEPFEYSGWAGYDALPEFAKTETGLVSQSLTDHIYAVTRRWMDPNGDGDPSDGIDGWRLDVPMHLPRQFWVDWRDYVKSINPQAYIVGEIWDPAEEWLDGKTFDAVMNYQWAAISFAWFANVNAKITASEFDRRLARLRVRYPRNHTHVLQNLYDSHDTDRWVSRIANPDMAYDAGNRVQDEGGDAYFDERPGEEHYRRMRLMALFQATYVGAPMIWYGTEVGMFGADDPRCRMPMWWDDLMPYDSPDYRIDGGLREEFRALFRLRGAHPVLRTGDFTTAVVDDAQDVHGFWRHGEPGEPRVLVVMNNGPAEATVTVPAPEGHILPGGFAGRTPRVLHATTGTTAPVVTGTTLRVTLPPVAGMVLGIE